MVALRRFVVEYVRVAFAGKNLPGTIIRWMSFVVVAFLAVRLEQGMNLTLGALLGAGVAVLYLAFVAGYAWARARWAVLRIDNEIIPDADGYAYSLKVFNDGLGTADVEVFITEVLDTDGNPLGNLSLPQQCYPDPDRPAPIRISRDVPANIRLLYLQGRKTDIGTERYLSIAAAQDRYWPILRFADAPLPRRRVKVTVRHPSHEQSRWFTVTQQNGRFHCVADQPQRVRRSKAPA